jgi:hypothetical protein
VGSGASPRGLVLVVGPARERRSEVAEAVAEAVRAAGGSADVRTWDVRPARRGRSLPVSWLRAAAALVRFLAAWGGWRRAARRQVVVVVGAWWDVAIEARGHGLSDRLLAPASLLGPAVPRADVAVVVPRDDGRRPRPRPDDADWAPWVWQELAPWMGRAVVESAGEVLAALGGEAPTPLRWARAPFTRRGRDLRATLGSGSRPALAMYHPRHLTGRASVAMNSALVSLRLAPPWVSPVDGLPELCRSIGVEPSGIATLRSGAPGRRVVGVAAEGGLRLVLKIGPADDPGLRREAATLERLGTGVPGVFRVPALRWSGPWYDRYVLATEAVESRGTPPHLDPDGLVDLCLALARGEPWGSPVVHGDLTPGNLLDSTGTVTLVDWESARFEEDALFDLAHFVIQQGVDGRYSASEAVRLLVAPGSAGRRYLEALGRDGAEAAPLVASYLARVAEPGPFHRSAVAALASAPVE